MRCRGMALAYGFVCSLINIVIKLYNFYLNIFFELRVTERTKIKGKLINKLTSEKAVSPINVSRQGNGVPA